MTTRQETDIEKACREGNSEYVINTIVSIDRVLRIAAEKGNIRVAECILNNFDREFYDYETSCTKILKIAAMNDQHEFTDMLFSRYIREYNKPHYLRIDISVKSLVDIFNSSTCDSTEFQEIKKVLNCYNSFKGSREVHLSF